MASRRTKNPDNRATRALLLGITIGLLVGAGAVYATGILDPGDPDDPGPDPDAPARSQGPEANEDPPPTSPFYSVHEICPQAYTLDDLRLVRVVLLDPTHHDIEEFYTAASEVFPEARLSGPEPVQQLKDAWTDREDDERILVLGDRPVLHPGFTNSSEKWNPGLVNGVQCGPRAYASHSGPECPWRTALHELGHLLGYTHEDGGVMEHGPCTLERPEKNHTPTPEEEDGTGRT